MDTVIALGTFDGMHPGHMAVIDRAVQEARNRGVPAWVYTFSNNPRSVFGTAPRELMSPAERERIMLSRGVDRVVFVEFDRALADTPPREFAAMLKREYGMAVAVAGEDYTFGSRGAGTVQALAEYGAELGFSVAVVPLVTVDGEKVSSTRMRAAAESGDGALYAKLSEGESV